MENLIHWFNMEIHILGWSGFIVGMVIVILMVLGTIAILVNTFSAPNEPNQ